MMARYTDAPPQDRFCATCGAFVQHQENELQDGRRWWSPVKHDAPCGAPCIGGGVKPQREDECPPGVSRIAFAHRGNGCGTPGCKGGRP